MHGPSFGILILKSACNVRQKYQKIKNEILLCVWVTTILKYFTPLYVNERLLLHFNISILSMLITKFIFLKVCICIFPNENVMFTFYIYIFAFRHFFPSDKRGEKKELKISRRSNNIRSFNKARFIRLYKPGYMQLSPYSPLNGLRGDIVLWVSFINNSLTKQYIWQTIISCLIMLDT